MKNQLLTSEDGPTAPDEVRSKPQRRAGRDHPGPNLEKSTQTLGKGAGGDRSSATHPRKGCGALKFHQAVSLGKYEEVFAKLNKVYEFINMKAW